MRNAVMKTACFTLIALFVSVNTAASSHRLHEIEEFYFEYDSESEDSPHRAFDGSTHKPDVESKTALGRSETFVWTQLDKVVQMLAKRLNSHADNARIKHVEDMQDRELIHYSSYHPIRFSIEYSSLDLLPFTSLENALRVVAIKNLIMPRILKTWQDVVYVQPLREALDLRSRPGGTLNRCFGTLMPPNPIPETDYLLVVNGETDDTYPCRLGNVAAYAGPCVFDEHNFNPRAGKITFCLERMETVDNVIPLDLIETTIFQGIDELGRGLGLSSDFLPFYTNPQSNFPYGFGPLSSHKCIASDSSISRLPANVQLGRDADNGNPSYEMSAPILTRVIQNQLNDPTLQGARLETQQSSGGTIGQCVGNRLDGRLFVNELVDNVTVQSIPVTTMAWLEETGWYKVDYRKAAPELNCPALCSGRGTCDWSGNKPRCRCDDADDRTPGCFRFVRDLNQTKVKDLIPQIPPQDLPATDAARTQLPTSIEGSFERQPPPTTRSGSPALKSVDGKIAKASNATNIGRRKVRCTGDSKPEEGDNEHLRGSNPTAGLRLKKKGEQKRRRRLTIRVKDLNRLNVSIAAGRKTSLSFVS